MSIVWPYGELLVAEGRAERMWFGDFEVVYDICVTDCVTVCCEKC